MTKDEKDFLTINIEYEEAIPLSEFTASLEGWNSQYNRHLSPAEIKENSDKLLIKQISKGSILVELMSSAMPLLSDYSNLYTFFSTMQILFNWLLSKKGKKPNVEIRDIEDAKKIVAPINTDDKKMNIFFNGDVQNVYIIDKVSAETITRNANDELLTFSKPEEIKEDQTNAKNVLLKFNQIEDAEKNNKKTRGIISEISNKSFPVMFSEGLKHGIVHGSENPHNKNYLVNAKVHIENDEIKAYTVLDVIDSFDDENNEPETILFS
jgi:hypothetical protein